MKRQAHPPRVQSAAFHGRAYRLRIALRGIQPPIWRRIRVPDTLPLSRLHDVIQTTFGWTDSHLHQFYIAGAAYGRPLDFDQTVLDEAGITLAHAVGAAIKRFLYVYDFGDDWIHDVTVEKLIAGNSGDERPQCLGGRRRRPPEDCGGVARYGDLLRVLRAPGHSRDDPVPEPASRRFDPEEFDLGAVNRVLARLSWGPVRVH